MDVDGVERRDQGVHIDNRNAGVDHLVDRRGQGADAERLDGDEIPLLRGHVVDRGAYAGAARRKDRLGKVDAVACEGRRQGLGGLEMAALDDLDEGHV